MLCLVLQYAASSTQDDAALTLWLQSLALGMWDITPLPWLDRLNAVQFIIATNDKGRMALNQYITTDDGFRAFNSTMPAQSFANLLFNLAVWQFDSQQLDRLDTFIKAKQDVAVVVTSYWQAGVQFARQYNVPEADAVYEQLSTFLHPQRRQQRTALAGGHQAGSMHAERRARLASRKIALTRMMRSEE